MQCLFRFYSIEVSVGSRDPYLQSEILKILKDFESFSVPSLTDSPQIQIVLERSSAQPPLILGKAAFKTENCKVFGWGSPRTCVFDEQHWLRYEKNDSGILIKIFGENLNQILSILRSSLVSAVNWELEADGNLQSLVAPSSPQSAPLPPMTELHFRLDEAPRILKIFGTRRLRSLWLRLRK